LRGGEQSARAHYTYTNRFSIAGLFLAIFGVLGAAGSPTASLKVDGGIEPAKMPAVHNLPLSSFNKVSPSKNHESRSRTDDEARIVRREKKPRIAISANGEPSDAVVDSTDRRATAVLLRPSNGAAASFVPPSNDEFRTIKAFHSKEADRLTGVPPALAELVTNDGADILATAYAPTDSYHPKSPFDSLLKGGETSGRYVPPMTNGDHDWMKIPLPPEVFSKEEQKCLATAIYFEARGESVKGQAAVAQVILNRVRNPAYPESVCGVVYQNDEWLNRCQFSFACDGVPERIIDHDAFRLARDVAMAVTGGKIFLPKVASSTHYYATYVTPSWAQSMERMTQIGSHLFYRTYGGGWS